MNQSFPLSSISALITEDMLREFSLKQTKRAADRGLISSQHIKRKERTAREGHAAIKRLEQWQKEYDSLQADWLKSIGTVEASRIKAQLHRYEQLIDDHIMNFGIRVGTFDDGYSYNPKARITIERDRFHPKHVGRGSTNTYADDEKRKRLKALVRSYHEQVAELEEEKMMNPEDKNLGELIDLQVKGLRTLILEKNREINRL